MEHISMATPETRRKPNILITGSPGTGKSTLGQQVAEKLGFEFIEISKEVRENQLQGEFDEQYNCHVLDEDKLLDHISERMDSDDGGIVVDYHGCDLFPERWFDVVVVLRCSTEKHYDRLQTRGYSDFKIKENVECEIFGTLLEEAKESYKEEIVHELQSETPEQMEENVEKICELAAAFKNEQHGMEQ
uniref:Adenylate kinase isoenzyme 6 homolog n=1 Tax=Caenorhabditis tropicalis TaxID=1561998 RepID=A0A1I7T4A7_9PELO